MQAHHAHLRYEHLNILMCQDILLGDPGGLQQRQLMISRLSVVVTWYICSDID